MKFCKCQIFAILLTICFCSCSNNQQTIQVQSTDYNIQNLQETSFSAIDTSFTLNEYSAYQCYVSKTNLYGNQRERLIINNDRYPHVHMCNSVNGFFVGYNYSEYLSGIYFIPATGIPNIESTQLLNGRCIGLFESNDPADDTCYAITSWNYFDEENRSISLYRLLPPTKTNDYLCSAELICEINEQHGVTAVPYMEDYFVATTESLFRITQDGIVTELRPPVEWERLQVNSMVELDHVLYAGTSNGVVAYSIQENEFRWFPVDYEEVLQD